MQWHKLIGTPTWAHRTNWSYPGAPRVGEMPPHLIDVLCEHLGANTKTPAQCFFAINAVTGLDGRDSADFMALTLPLERFTVFVGPLSAIADLRYPGSAVTGASLGSTTLAGRALGEPRRIGPNMVWPADHAWFVASPYELDSTLVGGTKNLVRELCCDDRIEAWPIQSKDSLNEDSDLLN
jgi:hypothetical protein